MTTTFFTPDADNVEFHMAVDFIENTQRHIFLTGKAGSGKTSFLKYIRRNTKKQMIVATPTSVEAVNVGGITLHSLFQLPFEPFVPNEGGERRLTYYLRMSNEKLAVLRMLEVLVIDDVNMLRADMLDAIDLILRRVRHNSAPFGGVQMVYIGDLFQLPPVIKDDEQYLLRHYYNSLFFFHSHVIKRCPPVYIELKNVYRQHDRAFVDFLNEIRCGNLSAGDMRLLNSRYIPSFSPLDGSKYIMLTAHNYRANRINTEALERLRGEMRCYTGILSGEFAEHAMPADMNLVLKVGAQVMFVKNDATDKRRYCNGQLAVVTRLADDAVFVYPEGAEREVGVERERWRNLRYVYDKKQYIIDEEEVGSFMQFPLRLAWAVTIRRSRGLTFGRVVLDVAKAFVPGQIYVALSRCRSFDGLVLSSPVKIEALQTDPYVQQFGRCELPLGVTRGLLQEEKMKFCRFKLLQAFDWSPLFRGLWDWRNLVHRKKLLSAVEVIILVDLLEKALKEQQNIAARFVSRLGATIDYSQQTGDFTATKTAVQRAVEYFHAALCREILVPVDKRINEVQFDRRKKTYRKLLENYRAVVARFMHGLCNLEYGGFPLVEGLSVPPIPPVTLEVKAENTK